MGVASITWNNWIMGVSNIAPDNALPKDKYGNVASLRDAVNVDVLTSGKLRRRTGIEQFIPDPGAHSVRNAGGRMVWATADALKIRKENTTITLLTDPRLANPLSYVTVNGRTYFSNEAINGIINVDGTYEPWGIQSPTSAPTLAAAAGKYQYQVTCTFVTAEGEESGAPLAAQVLCDDIPVITITNIPQSSDPRVVATRLYVTNIDGSMFYRAMDVSKGITTATLTGFYDSGMTLKTQFMDPPPPGQLLEYNNGIIYIASGSAIYRTQPLRYGLHDPAIDFYMYSERVTLLKAVPDGLYVSAEQIYYLPQAGTDEVQQIQTIPGKAIEGAVCNLPDTEDIMFVTDRGFVRASLQGQVQHLTEGQIAMDFYPRGAMSFVEKDGHRAIMAIFEVGKENRAVSEDFRLEDKARKSTRV